VRKQKNNNNNKERHKKKKFGAKKKRNLILPDLRGGGLDGKIGSFGIQYVNSPV
jgi:hypothetical protein